MYFTPSKLGLKCWLWTPVICLIFLCAVLSVTNFSGVRKWTGFHRYIYCFLYIEVSQFSVIVRTVVIMNRDFWSSSGWLQCQVKQYKSSRYTPHPHNYQVKQYKSSRYTPHPHNYQVKQYKSSRYTPHPHNYQVKQYKSSRYTPHPHN